MTTIVRKRRLGMSSVRGIEAASTQGITWCRHDQGVPNDDVYVRWGCTATLPNPAASVINSAAGIHRVSDKSGFRMEMQRHGLCPATWWHPVDIPDAHQGPWIVRTRTHAQGRGMWVCYTRGTLSEAFSRAGEDAYINEYLPKVAEFRVFVIQGRVAWVAEKTPGNYEDVAWNVARGGRFDNVRWDDWNQAVVENALAVFTLTGLHFSGIDVMLLADGTATCVEANSAPSQTSPYRQGCVAKALDYMVARANYDMTLGPVTGGWNWKNVIHPGVYTRRSER